MATIFEQHAIMDELYTKCRKLEVDCRKLNADLDIMIDGRDWWRKRCERFENELIAERKDCANKIITACGCFGSMCFSGEIPILQETGEVLALRKRVDRLLKLLKHLEDYQQKQYKELTHDKRVLEQRIKTLKAEAAAFNVEVSDTIDGADEAFGILEEQLAHANTRIKMLEDNRDYWYNEVLRLKCMHCDGNFKHSQGCPANTREDPEGC